MEGYPEAEIDRRQKALLDETFEALERLLRSSNPDSVQFAISTVLKLNRRYPEQSVKVTHEGTVTHQGKRLTAEKKQRIKALLAATRGLGGKTEGTRRPCRPPRPLAEEIPGRVDVYPLWGSLFRLPALL